jgi:predicted transposase/invertase (TIGR01784 family)
MEICLDNDIAFKWSFGRQERTKPLISLLNAIVKYRRHIGTARFREIRIMNPFDISKYQEDKRGILDLRVKETGTGVWADVEVQVTHQKFYPERSMFYLAGLYRDQLNAGQNYDALRPCYGFHILTSDLFEDETDWYNCYRMMNVKSRKVLSRHWNLYYLELAKFQKAVKKGGRHKELELWCEYLSEPHDPSEALDEKFKNSEGIREVHEMLREFIKDERLREQYRLHQEWLREQRTIEAEHRKTEAEYRKTVEKLTAETNLRRKAEAEKKKAEAELKEKERCSVLALRKAGYKDRDIAGLLGIPEKRVKAVREK